MSKVKVKIADENDLEKWDESVDSSVHGTIFHKLDWLHAAAEKTKTALLPLMGFRGQDAIALFPVFI